MLNWLSAFSHQSPPLTPKNVAEQDLPTAFVILNDADLANSNSSRIVQEDEPSAADYDPTVDMQEDQLRYDQRHREDELLPVHCDKTSPTWQDNRHPNAIVTLPVDNRSQDEYDMFAEGDEVDFLEKPALDSNQNELQQETSQAVPVIQAKALDMSMLDDWDDQDGYYKVILGELLDGRYHVQSNLGKGMFSGVVRATDQKTTKLVALKIIRNNETM